MLERCREKAREAGLKNLTCRVGGVLTYRDTEPPADAMVSVAALHHLPDFWKQVGLRRAARMPERRELFLFDIVFPSAAQDLDGRIELMDSFIRKKAGSRLAKEAEGAHLQGVSTYDWAMEGLLRRAGSRIAGKHTARVFRPCTCGYAV